MHELNLLKHIHTHIYIHSSGVIEFAWNLSLALFCYWGSHKQRFGYLWLHTDQFTSFQQKFRFVCLHAFQVELTADIRLHFSFLVGKPPGLWIGCWYRRCMTRFQESPPVSGCCSWWRESIFLEALRKSICKDSALKVSSVRGSTEVPTECLEFWIHLAWFYGCERIAARLLMWSQSLASSEQRSLCVTEFYRLNIVHPLDASSNQIVPVEQSYARLVYRAYLNQFITWRKYPSRFVMCYNHAFWC